MKHLWCFFGKHKRITGQSNSALAGNIVYPFSAAMAAAIWGSSSGGI